MTTRQFAKYNERTDTIAISPFVQLSAEAYCSLIGVTSVYGKTGKVEPFDAPHGALDPLARFSSEIVKEVIWADDEKLERMMDGMSDAELTAILGELKKIPDGNYSEIDTPQ